MPLLLVGLNHTTAPLEVRERFALSSEQGGQMLERLGTYISHAVVLATCNRTEIYTTVHNTQVGVHHLQRFLSDWASIPTDEVLSYLYSYSHWAAVRHLFRVAAGLDSMILGEEQILGQVRTAMEQARRKQALDPVLAAAFRHALRAGRRARVETALSRHAVSVSSVAVNLAKSFFGGLEHLRVLVISAGAAGKLASRSLVGQGVQHLRVTNRNFQRAKELAQRMGGEAVPFSQLEEALHQSDFVVSATGASEHILSEDQVAGVMARRPYRPLLLVDIAVPRDVAPEVARVPGVSLYNIDDVQAFAQRNLDLRSQEVAKAESIIDAELAKFQRWWRTQDVVPTIAALLSKAEEIRTQELSKTLPRLPSLSESERGRVEAMSKAIIKKLLHEPLMYLKERRNGEASTEAVEALFGLDTTPSPPSPVSGPKK